MCAASNRSRERENKNENRDNYLQEIIYYMSAEILLRIYEQFVNNTRFLHFFVSLRNNRGYFLLKNGVSLLKKLNFGRFLPPFYVNNRKFKVIYFSKIRKNMFP